MKFSGLIAAYQADAVIAEVLKGVRQQTHVGWELIVLEDGSRRRQPVHRIVCK